MKLWRGDTSGQPIADSALTSSQLQATFAALSPDTYYWRVWAADGVANEASSSLKSFTVYRTRDVTADGNVNAEDYFSVGRIFGTANTALPDLDLDGDVDKDDVKIMMNAE